MNIIVCVKQVPDPETPPSGFKVDAQAKLVIPPLGTAPVINPFDENAVEAALKLRDTYGARVTALTMGHLDAEDVLRQAMAMGVDEGVLLQYPLTDGFDSFSTAYRLAAAIRKLGGADLILCGREAADWNSGQVGLGIAELLGLPGVSLVKNIQLVSDKLKVERVVPNGYEIIEVALPALLTITNEVGTPRLPTVKGVLAATKKAITSWSMSDIGISADSDRRLRLVELVIPVYQRKCHIFKADTLEEAAVALAKKITELVPG